VLSLQDTLLLDDKLIGFRAHQQLDRLYLLPSAVELKTDADENPQFMLLLYAGEERERSFLTLQLAFQYPETDALSELVSDQSVVSHVPFESGSVRISMTVPDVDDNRTVETEWADFQIDDDLLSKVTIELDRNSSLILEELLNNSDTAVEPLQVEVEVRYSGFRGAFPATFSFKPYDLFQHYMTELGLPDDAMMDLNVVDIPALPVETVDEIHHRWITQTESETEIRPIEQATDSHVIDELLLRLSSMAWKQNGGAMYELQPVALWQGLEQLSVDGEDISPDVTVSWNLRAPKIDHRSWHAIWNFSAFWSGLSDDVKSDLFSKVPVPEPFSLIPIDVVNSFSFESGEFKKVILKLHYYGASQEWEDHELCLNDIEGVGARNIAVLPDGSPFFYYYAIEAFYHAPAGGGWPPQPIRTGIKESKDPFIHISPSLLGIQQLSIQVQESAFDSIGDVEVQLCERTDPDDQGHQTTVILSRETPKREITTRKGDVAYYHFYRILIHPPTGLEAEPVGSEQWLSVPEERILITSYQTQVIAPDFIELKLSPSETYPADIVLLYLKASDATDSFEGELIKLDRETTESSWTLWRETPFSGLSYRWKSEIYFSSDAGLPATLSDWKLSSEERLLFDSFEEDA